MTHQLDYSALKEPVTKADIDAYKSSGLSSSGFQIGNIITVVVLTMIIFLVAPLAVSIFQHSGFSLASLAPIVLIGTFMIAIWQMFGNTTKRRAKLYKFAQRNNVSFLVDVSDPGYMGMIFDNGHGRQVNDALRFSGDTEIGNYTYVTGSGKNQQTHEWGYAKIKMTRRLPNMVLDAKGNNFWKFSNLSDTLDRSQTLALEGDFNTYFTLYTPKQYERDALYVFTPDVMAAMIDHGKEYDIEIVDDELFIYSNKHFKLDQPEFYEHILAIIDTISKELISQTDYYADERIGSHAANIIAPGGQRLKSRFNWIIVAFMLIIFYFNIVQPIILRLTRD